MSRTKLLLLAVIVAIIGGFFLFGPKHFLTLEYIQSQLDTIRGYHELYPFGSVLAFIAIYIGVTASMLPGALVLTLLGGAIFGFALGTLSALIAATIGATIAFLLARYLFRDLVENRMGERLSAIQENFRKEGALYLFSMRLVPVFPFFVINLLMGLTPIRVSTFAIASFIGMAPGSMVFVNAGAQLGQLQSLQGLLSPTMIVSFLLLALFPYVAKFLLKRIRSANSISVTPGHSDE